MHHDDPTRLALVEQQVRMHMEDCILDRQAVEHRHKDLKSYFEDAVRELRSEFRTSHNSLENKFSAFDNKLWAIVAVITVGVLAEIIKAVLK